MKKLITLVVVGLTMIDLNAQRGKGIDMTTGNEILRLLPTAMQAQNHNTKNDKVFAAKGIVGVTVHRDYGAAHKKINLDVINNSPSVANVNTILAETSPNDSAHYTVIQINGYKALMQPFYGEASKSGYELLIPVNTTLITLKTFDYTKDQFLKIANTIPIAMIAQKVK